MRWLGGCTCLGASVSRSNHRTGPAVHRRHRSPAPLRLAHEAVALHCNRHVDPLAFESRMLMNVDCVRLATPADTAFQVWRHSGDKSCCTAEVDVEARHP